MDRPQRPRSGMPDLRDGLDGAAPCRSADQRRAQSDQRPAAMDHRHLRLLRRRRAGDDGHSGRPHRPPPAADDRRRRIRRVLGARRTFDQRRDADRQSRAARTGRCHTRAVDACPDLLHVRRPETALSRRRGLDRRILGRQRDRAGARRTDARVLLVGIGLPDRPAGHRPVARARPARAARISRSRSRSARPGERRDVDRGHASRHLRPQAARPGRRVGRAGGDDRCRPDRWRALGPPPAASCPTR